MAKREILELDWEATIRQTVRIYRNLLNHRMSIQVKVPGRGWIVVGHVTEAIVADVSFHVSESGRQRVIRDRCKNVHAWGEGKLIAQYAPKIHAPIDLKYNPYTDETFVERHTQKVITQCKYLVVRDNLVYVTPDAVPQPVETKLKITLKPYRKRVPLIFYGVPQAA